MKISKLAAIVLACVILPMDSIAKADQANIWTPNPFQTDFDKDVHWSAQTNFVKAGLVIKYAPDTNRTVVGGFPVLLNESATNGNLRPDWLELWLPPIESRYQMTLLDEKGTPVPKTIRGKKLGKSVNTVDIERHHVDIYHGYWGRILSPKLADLIPEPFLLRDYFTITKPGKYRLEFELRAIKKGYGVYYFPVNMEIEIKNP